MQVHLTPFHKLGIKLGMILVALFLVAISITVLIRVIEF